MRLSIDHHTRYRFSQPQARVVQLLRMTPSDFAAQTVVDWRIDVDCDARLRSGRDGFGNATTMLYIDGPIEALSLTVRGEVLTEDMAGVVRGASEPLPPLFFTRSTPSTAIDATVVDFARGVGASDPLERVHALGALVGGALTLVPGRGSLAATPAASIGFARGTVRDLAHLLVAVARSRGYPARVVAGHSLYDPGRGARQSAHYWGELFVDRLGWVALDPSTGLSPDESTVRVAVGLDAGDATPVSGTRRGGGIEELDVDVRVGVAE